MRHVAEHIFPCHDGPLSMSEADLAALAALEERHEAMKQARILVRQHLTHCEHGDAKTLFAFDTLMQYIGIHEDDKPITKPQAEMACHHED